MLLHIKTTLCRGGTWSDVLLDTKVQVKRLSELEWRKPAAIALEFADVLDRRFKEVADKLFERPGSKAWIELPDGRKLEVKLEPKLVQ